MDDIVEGYLVKAFAFIYIINIANAGGVQKDRVGKKYLWYIYVKVKAIYLYIYSYISSSYISLF